MKTNLTIMMILASMAVSGCWYNSTSSPEGGIVPVGGQFSISVPTFNTNVSQGDRQIVHVLLQRDPLFKQDVKLHIKAPKGISVEPTSITIKASDKPNVELQVAAPRDAAIGEYIVIVNGEPSKGESTAVRFTVMVKAQ